MARQLGVLVVMDCHDTPHTLESPAVRQILALVDVFTPNDVEAVRLTGIGELEAAITELSALVPTLVVPRGANGAIAVRDGKRHDVPAARVTRVDTTAAGDCFNAGPVHGMLAGWPLPDCLAAAAICGAAATIGVGSSTALDAAALSRRFRPGPGPFASQTE